MFENWILKLVNEKKLIFIKGKAGSTKELLLYYFHCKLSGDLKTSSRFFVIDSFNKGRVVNISQRDKKNENFETDDIKYGDRKVYKDIIYDLGNEENKSSDLFQAVRKSYLSRHSTIFFSSFLERKLSIKIEESADYSITCKEIQFIFNKYVILYFKVEGYFLSQSLVLRKSFYDEFIFNVIENKLFRKFF